MHWLSKIPLRISTLLGSAAIALGLGMGLVPTAAQAAVTVTATTHMTNHPDSGNHGDWATDTFDRSASVTPGGLQVGNTDCGTLVPCYKYTGMLSDNGSFLAADGLLSPQAGAVIDGPVNGSFNGGAMAGTGTFTFYANSPAPSDVGVPTSVNGAGPSTSSWMKLFFPGGTLFSGDLLPGWSWTYGDSLHCQQWIDALSNSDGSLPADGDITGVDHCVTSVTNPGNQFTPVHSSVNLQIHAGTTSSNTTLSYVASGLPAGLSINAATGLITGSPTTVENTDVATITVTDFDGVSASVAFGWTVTVGAPPPPPVASKLTAHDVCGPYTARNWSISNVAGGRSRTFDVSTLLNSGKWFADGSGHVSAGASVGFVTHRGTTLKLRWGNGLGKFVTAMFPVTTAVACI